MNSQLVSNQVNNPIFNIYDELSKIPPDMADKITHAKSHGGRALDAIWHSTKLSNNEKLILLFLGSQMNYCADFANQYRFVSLAKIAEFTSLSRRAVINVLNGYKKGDAHILGLIDKGYVSKKIASKQDQAKGYSNHYCLTAQIFNEYMAKMIKKQSQKKEQNSINVQLQGSATDSPPQCNSFTPPSEMVAPKVPVFKCPKEIPNVCEKEKTHTPKKLKAHPQKYLTKDENVPSSIIWKLSEYLCVRLRRKFVANDDCRQIIKEVIKNLECSIDDIRLAMNDSIKNEICILKNTTKFDVSQISLDFCEFIKNKDFIIKDVLTQREIVEKEQISPKIILNNASFQLRKTNENKDYIGLDKNIINNFPEDFKQIFKTYNKTNKLFIMKEVNEMGLEFFLKSRASMLMKTHSFKNFSFEY